MKENENRFLSSGVRTIRNLTFDLPLYRVSLYFLPKIEECASLPPLDNPTAFFSHELDNSSSMRSD